MFYSLFAFLFIILFIFVAFLIIFFSSKTTFPSNYTCEVSPENTLILYGVIGDDTFEVDKLPNHAKICKLNNGLVVSIYDYCSYGRWLDAAEAVAYMILDRSEYERIEIYLQDNNSELFITQVTNENKSRRNFTSTNKSLQYF